MWDAPRLSAIRRAAFLVALAPLLVAGCSTARLGTARAQYYRGNYDQAAETLEDLATDDRNMVLALMERGMIHHTRGDYAGSNADWIDAAAQIEKLDYLSVSEGATSLIINDATQTYTGAPYERSLLHAFTAKNYFALSLWHEAAVEARLIADGLADLNGFPDDPYSRYVAGVAFEMIRDFSGAKIEYSKANELTKHLAIDGQSGRIAQADATAATHHPPPAELVCLIGIGNAPTPNVTPRSNARWGKKPYVEVLCNGSVLGRSHTLSTTASLLTATQRRIAALKAAKTATRIVLKETIAAAVSEQNSFLGEVLRLILYALEAPDTRGWETLPMWLQVARVPCPTEPSEVTLVFRSAAGVEVSRQRLTPPFAKRDSKIVIFARSP